MIDEEQAAEISCIKQGMDALRDEIRQLKEDIETGRCRTNRLEDWCSDQEISTPIAVCGACWGTGRVLAGSFEGDSPPYKAPCPFCRPTGRASPCRS